MHWYIFACCNHIYALAQDFSLHTITHTGTRLQHAHIYMHWYMIADVAQHTDIHGCSMHTLTYVPVHGYNTYTITSTCTWLLHACTHGIRKYSEYTFPVASLDVTGHGSFFTRADGHYYMVKLALLGPGWPLILSFGFGYACVHAAIRHVPAVCVILCIMLQ